MPVFGSPFSRSASDRKLTDEELIRAIRFMVAAEYEATQLYMQLAESTDNKLAVEVLKDIADEEWVHAGEFLRLRRKVLCRGGSRSRRRNRENEITLVQISEAIRGLSPRMGSNPNTFVNPSVWVVQGAAG